MELHLLHEPSTSISDADLVVFIHEIQASSPHIGQSLLLGRLRSMEYKVTRERVREALRLTVSSNNSRTEQESLNCVIVQGNRNLQSDKTLVVTKRILL